MCGGKGFDLPIIDTNKSRPGSCGPNAACRIGKDVPDFQMRKSVAGIHDLELSPCIRDQPAAGGADPEGAVFVKIKRAEPTGRQSIRFLVDLRDAFIPAQQTVFSRRPNDTVARLCKGPDPPTFHQCIIERGFKTSIAMACRTTAVTYPKIAFGVLHKTEYWPRQHFGYRGRFKRGETNTVEPREPACRPHPKITSPGLIHSLDSVQRQPLFGLPAIDFVLGD